MSNQCVFENTLLYTAPSHGDWGVVRIASLVPETHMLFVCPFACGRHGSLGAIGEGFKHRVSYLFITQKDIIDGYDKTIEKAVDEMLKRLNPLPKGVYIFVSCLDDLIGTDLDALIKQLSKGHPGIHFMEAHMNPITLDSKTPPPVTIQDSMFGFLSPSTKEDKTINFIGNLVQLDKACELFEMLEFAGIKKIRHLSNYSRFEDFQEMASSKYNLVLSPIALLAAKNMQKKHGIPFLMLPVSYNLTDIGAQYRSIFQFLKAESKEDKYDISIHYAKAKQAIEDTLAVLKNTPIVISSDAIIKPFSLAASLMEYGFRVDTVIAQEVLPIDEEGYGQVCDSSTTVRIIQPQHANTIRFAHRIEDAIAIGFDAAYITGSCHIVDIMNDQRMFGYNGIVNLMKKMREALTSKADLKSMLLDYGVVV